MTHRQLRVATLALQAKPRLAVRPTPLAARPAALTVHLAALAVPLLALLVTLPVARVAPKQVAPVRLAKVAGVARAQVAKGERSIRWLARPSSTSTT